jgi:hypothetical protein
MKRVLLGLCCLCACLEVAACGSGGKVSSASLQPRLLSASSVPGFAIQRKFDWSDPVNLVGEGLALPARTRPSEAVREFTGARYRGAAGEVIANGISVEATEVRLGVARFDSSADANRVRDWMHGEDLKQPCFQQCIFAPGNVPVTGIPAARFVVQTSHRPSGPPPGVRIPRGVRVPSTVGQAPSNYLAEFTVGPYLYWVILEGAPGAQAKFEQGLRLYYAHARQSGV